MSNILWGLSFAASYVVWGFVWFIMGYGRGYDKCRTEIQYIFSIAEQQGNDAGQNLDNGNRRENPGQQDANESYH